MTRHEVIYFGPFKPGSRSFHHDSNPIGPCVWGYFLFVRCIDLDFRTSGSVNSSIIFNRLVDRRRFHPFPVSPPSG